MAFLISYVTSFFTTTAPTNTAPSPTQSAPQNNSQLPPTIICAKCNQLLTERQVFLLYSDGTYTHKDQKVCKPRSYSGPLVEGFDDTPYRALENKGDAKTNSNKEQKQNSNSSSGSGSCVGNDCCFCCYGGESTCKCLGKCTELFCNCAFKGCQLLGQCCVGVGHCCEACCQGGCSGGCFC